MYCVRQRMFLIVLGHTLKKHNLFMVLITNRHSFSQHGSHRLIKKEVWRPSYTNKSSITKAKDNKASLIICLSGTLLVIFKFNLFVLRRTLFQCSYRLSVSAEELCSQDANEGRTEAAFGDWNCFPVTDCPDQSSAKTMRTIILQQHICEKNRSDLKIHKSISRESEVALSKS